MTEFSLKKLHADAVPGALKRAEKAMQRAALSGLMARLSRLVFCLVALGPARLSCETCAPGAW